MAIDTSNKRLSALHYGRAAVPAMPDGTVNPNDRAALTGAYAGFLAFGEVTGWLSGARFMGWRLRHPAVYAGGR